MDAGQRVSMPSNLKRTWARAFGIEGGVKLRFHNKWGGFKEWLGSHGRSHDVRHDPGLGLARKPEGKRAAPAMWGDREGMGGTATQSG